MKGQIEEQHGNDISTVREAYKNGVSIRLRFVIFAVIRCKTAVILAVIIS